MEIFIILDSAAAPLDRIVLQQGSILLRTRLRVQWTHADLGPSYVRKGFHNLLEVSRWKGLSDEASPAKLKWTLLWGFVHQSFESFDLG